MCARNNNISLTISLSLSATSSLLLLVVLGLDFSMENAEKSDASPQPNILSLSRKLLEAASTRHWRSRKLRPCVAFTQPVTQNLNVKSKYTSLHPPPSVPCSFADNSCFLLLFKRDFPHERDCVGTSKPPRARIPSTRPFIPHSTNFSTALSLADPLRSPNAQPSHFPIRRPPRHLHRTRLHNRHLHPPIEPRQNLDMVATASQRSRYRKTRDILHDGP